MLYNQSTVPVILTNISEIQLYLSVYFIGAVKLLLISFLN